MTITLWQAALWGLLQGLTEFLPVSSSGHLAIVPWIVGLPTPDLTFDLVVHLGTLLAVIVFMWGDICSLWAALVHIVRTRRVEGPQERLVIWLVVGTVPAAVAGAFAQDLVERLISAPWAIALFLALTGTLLYIAERLGRRERPLEALGLGDTLSIGLAQALALIPGLSRSGATISAGLLRGLTRDAAARFSFLLSMPIIAGAALVHVGDALAKGLSSDVALTLAVGLVVAGSSGFLALRFLFRHIQKRSLRPFAFYCWGLAALGIILSFAR